MHPFRAVLALLATAILTACGGGGATNITNYTETFDNRGRKQPSQAPKNIVIFFDGTGNTQASRTNVSRLFELVENQNRKDLVIFYTTGVGADRTSLVGMATGLGTKNDVQAAYRFLAENWTSPRDRVFLYGFSRGAWSARILAGFIHAAGLVQFSAESTGDLAAPDRLTRKAEIARREDIVRALYRAYKGREFPVGTKLEERIGHRRAWVQTVIDRRGLVINPGATRTSFRFDVVGLFDTVEALGIPNGRDQVDFVNDRYTDQICNMRRVFHAVALDDNRATTYTPVLMTRTPLVAPCIDGTTPDINRVVDEVWFSGAHADVGGGSRNGQLPGVALNWMIRKTGGFGVGGRSIFPQGAAVFENVHDIAHDAEGYSLFFNVFNKQHRGLVAYLESELSAAQPRRIKLHRSVIHRLESYYRRVDPLSRVRADGEAPRVLEHEAIIPRAGGPGLWDRLKGQREDPLRGLRDACFTPTAKGGYRYRASCPYFTVVD